MKLLFLLTSFFLFQELVFCQNIDSLISVLEHKMEKQKVFDKAKENQIKRLLDDYFKTNVLEEKTLSIFESLREDIPLFSGRSESRS